VNRLKIQRLESRIKTRDIYKVVGCLMPYRLCALTSAQLKLSSVRFMQHYSVLATPSSPDIHVQNGIDSLLDSSRDFTIE